MLPAPVNLSLCTEFADALKNGLGLGRWREAKSSICVHDGELIHSTLYLFRILLAEVTI